MVVPILFHHYIIITNHHIIILFTLKIPFTNPYYPNNRFIHPKIHPPPQTHSPSFHPSIHPSKNHIHHPKFLRHHFIHEFIRPKSHQLPHHPHHLPPQYLKNIHIPVLGAIAQTRQGVPYRILGLGLGFRQCTEQHTRPYILALLHLSYCHVQRETRCSTATSFVPFFHLPSIF